MTIVVYYLYLWKLFISPFEVKSPFNEFSVESSSGWEPSWITSIGNFLLDNSSFSLTDINYLVNQLVTSPDRDSLERVFNAWRCRHRTIKRSASQVVHKSEGGRRHTGDKQETLPRYTDRKMCHVDAG